MFTLLGRLWLFPEKHWLIFYWWFMWFISGSVVSVLECLLPALSNKEKSTSHVLHIFTVTSPPQQQCFRFVQVRVLASAWSCQPFLPLVVPLADQIVQSAPDKTTLILCHCVCCPVPSCPLTRWPAHPPLLSFSCWQTAKGQAGRHVTWKEKRGCLRKKHVFKEGSDVTWLSVSQTMVQETVL